MAQQLGAIRFKGKVANVVGFKNSASLKTNNNFVRERATVVSNPKTQAQARQRAKVIPAQNFYAAFENVLNHAFLPLERASRNRNVFMSKAMKLDEVPNVLKGESKLPLCHYQVSQGSLGLDDMTRQLYPHLSGVIFNTECEHVDMTASVATFSETILRGNSAFAEGMELTFIAILQDSNGGNYTLQASVVLDTTNTLTTLTDIFGTDLKLGEADEKLKVDSNSGVILASAMIISSRAGNTWRYTNSYMCLSNDGEQEKATPSESEVIASYMSAASTRTSDLVLQQADNSQSGGVHLSSVTTANITLATGVTGTLSANAANVAVKSTGDRMLVVLDGALTTGAAGSRVAITITPAGGTARPLTPADTTFAGNESITVAELEAAGL